jgi:hypothetical protein
MFDQQHNIMPQSPKTINKYLTNRFGTINHHAHLNLNQHQQQQYIDLNGQMPNPPVLPPPTMATTAYLVQTANGSALLIPPQTPLNPTNHFIQTNSSSFIHSSFLIIIFYVSAFKCTFPNHTRILHYSTLVLHRSPPSARARLA